MTTRETFEVVGFIDAGFLKAEGARALKMKRRTRVRLDAEECVRVLSIHASPSRAARLLRVYWYDGAFDPRDERSKSQRRYFDAIASVPGVQLRLGHVQQTTPGWQHALRKALEACGVDQDEFEQHFKLRPELRQKGVDTLLTLDLVRLAQRRVYDAALLVAGDRDLAEPVRVAQDEGCRIILLHPERAGVATELRQLADAVMPLDADDLGRMLKEG